MYKEKKKKKKTKQVKTSEYAYTDTRDFLEFPRISF